MTRLKYILGLTIVASLTLGMAGDSDAFWKRVRDIKNKKQKDAPFSISGSYTGLVEGNMRVNNHEFVVTKNTSIYVSGKGIEGASPFVRNANVYVGGMRRNGVRVARFVIVRPSDASLIRQPRSDTSAHIIPSTTNPKVGRIANGYE